MYICTFLSFFGVCVCACVCAFKFISTFSPKKWNQIYETVIVFTETSIQESHTHNLHENKTEICPTQIEVQRNSLKCTHTQIFLFRLGRCVLCCVYVPFDLKWYTCWTHQTEFTSRILRFFSSSIAEWNKKNRVPTRMRQNERERKSNVSKMIPGSKQMQTVCEEEEEEESVCNSFFLSTAEIEREKKLVAHLRWACVVTLVCVWMAVRSNELRAGNLVVDARYWEGNTPSNVINIEQW